MTIDRRRLFALGGVGAFGAGTGLLGPEFDHITAGIVVRLYQESDGGWKVVVPDWGFIEDDSFGGIYRWRPGQQLRTRGMPLEEFLAQMSGVDKA